MTVRGEGPPELATLGDLLELSDTEGGMTPMPRTFAMAASGGAGSAPELDLEPQSQTVTASVVARFALDGAPSSEELPD